jgi:hypothetical protein
MELGSFISHVPDLYGTLISRRGEISKLSFIRKRPIRGSELILQFGFFTVLYYLSKTLNAASVLGSTV